MYGDVFCRVYNELGWNFYPEAFAGQLLQWLRAQGAEVKTALDLGCGTGVLCRILSDSGIETAGMDLSAGMIAIAREMDPQGRYDVADMVPYRPERKFDLVTCTGDALNHIPALSDVETILRNVHGYLREGGWLVFDILNEKEVSDSEPFELDFDEQTHVWFQMTRPDAKSVELKIRVWEAGILKCEETIPETIHDPDVICGMLREIGFRTVRCAHSLTEAGNQATTWFVTAQRCV